jgi:hypothetical protein
MCCGRTGDLEGAVGFYRSVLEHGGPVYANSFVALLTAYAEKVNGVFFKIVHQAENVAMSGNRWFPCIQLEQSNTGIDFLLFSFKIIIFSS